MKISLTNFGTWKNSSFVIPDEGLTLIAGPTGKGKTTILRAINYALTGNGTKIVSHGETKCSVTLEYKGLKITRTNRPSRLVVVTEDGCQSEDDKAQSIIYYTIGKHFNMAGYIQQKGENSFLAMAPAEKLRFLEKVVFSDVPIDEIKERSKDICNQVELSLSSAEGKLATLKSIVPVRMEKPLKTVTELKSQRDVDSHTIKLLERDIADLQKRIMQAEIVEVKRESLSKQISDIQIPVVPEKIDYKSELLMLQEHQKYEEYLRMVKQRDQINETHLKPHQKQIESLTEAFQAMTVSEFSSESAQELKDLREALQAYRLQEQYNKVRASYNGARHVQLQDTLPGLRSQLTSYCMGKDAKSCPHCKSSLRFVSGSLELYAGSKYSAETEAKMRKELQEQESELRALTELKGKIDTFPVEEIDLDPVEVAERIKELEAEQAEYTKNKANRDSAEKALQAAKTNTSIQKLEKQWSELSSQQPVECPKETKEVLQKKVDQGKDRDRDILSAEKRVKELTDKLASLKKELDKLPVTVDTVPLKESLATSQDMLKEYRNGLPLLEKQILEAQMYERLEVEYQNHQQSLKETHELHRSLQEKFTAAKKFREAVTTAELLAIQTLIDEINTHLNQYLSLFFPDNPLTIDVCLFKTNEKTKTVRNQVNLQVGYHGVVTDLSTLSGGEKDRVNLAFTLALAEIFNLPMLILDETLSSLDQLTAENVLEHIQKDTRTVIVVAHQATTGLFDNVIKL